MIYQYNPIIQRIREQHQTMVEQLHSLCIINSGTENLAGIAKVREALTQLFEPLADSIEIIPLTPLSIVNMAGSKATQPCGEVLMIRKRPHLKRRVLLTGHMDTVYSATHPFQHLSYLNDNTINGPGVADMKGGLLVMLHALLAFESTETAQTLGWDVLINADEEIGSPASGPLFEKIALNYQAGLVYEPAMTADGTLAKNRKGSGKITLVAKGKAAHAGRAFDEGRNAICYLAEAITAIHALNGQREGVTLNIGKISGGEALNVVPDTAVAKIDIRISASDDEHWVREALEKIQHQLARPDYQLLIDGHFGRPVKRVGPGTERLFHRIQAIGRELGLNIDWKDSGGCCDGNNLAKSGLPVIDTLGVRGGNIHSTEEYILLDSLTERAILSALLLVDLAQGGLEDLKA